MSEFLKSGLTLRRAYHLRSPVHHNADFFAAQIVGAQLAPAVGVWLIAGAANSPGLTMSVDAFAKEYSVAPDGSTTAAHATMADPGAIELQHWVESQVP